MLKLRIMIIIVYIVLFIEMDYFFCFLKHLFATPDQSIWSSCSGGGETVERLDAVA